MKVFTKEKVVFEFSKDNAPVYFVDNGETFWVETDDCYSGQIKNEQILRPDIDISIMDCSVGPIAVKDAEPGDVLCIEILAIQLAKQGVMVTSPGLGILGEKIQFADTKIITIEDGFARFSDDIKIPLTPMIGVLGVAPAEGSVHCAVPGDHGSNMDTKLIRAGSKVFLPVFVSGANMALGDLHACMGDGELSGTGIETAGRVCLKVDVYKSEKLLRPMIETTDSIYTIASRTDIKDAVRIAVNDMVEFLMHKKRLPFDDAYRLLSATCDIQISQLVNESITVRVRAPKLDLQLQTVF